MGESDSSSDARPDSRARFATTRWSVVLAAQSEQAPQVRAALETLCGTYWAPLYAFLRRSGCERAEAEDVLQSFFARLLEKHDLATVAPQRGRFRSFLLASLKHFLANQRDYARAFKRGGGQAILSLDFSAAETSFLAYLPAGDRTADEVFQRQWALTLLDRVRETLRDEYRRTGKDARLEQLLPLLNAEPDASYQHAAEALGMTENAVMVAVHRLRQRFGAVLRSEIMQTVACDDDIDDEIRDLFQALRS